MSEQDPSFILHLENTEFEARPDNTTLFTFLGRTALNGVDFDNSRANHLFLQTDETKEDGTLPGTYCFLGEEQIAQLLPFMVNNGFPCILNRYELAECDMEALKQLMDKQIEAATESLDDELDKLLGEEDGETKAE